jgi:phosphohistidine phosphatase
MKRLLLVRHAKSAWDNLSLADFERPLNDRGKRDAPKMADKLYNKGVRVETFVSSPAKRAKKTAEVFAEKFNVKKNDIILVPALYEASENTFFDVITSLSINSDCIALFSHNPGITGFANRLTSTRIDNMPTCSIFAVTADIKDWTEFKSGNKQFDFFDFPKSMHDD